MKISTTMDLGQLAEQMGGDASLVEAAQMRDFLVASEHNDTRDVTESEWIAHLARIWRIPSWRVCKE